MRLLLKNRLELGRDGVVVLGASGHRLEDGPAVQTDLGVGGPGGEAVALDELLRARDGAAHLVQALGSRLDGQDRPQQAAGVLVDGVGQQLGGRGLLDDLSGVHDGDAVGDLGDQSQVVADEDHGEAEPLAQLAQQVDDLLLDGHVQGGGGLVGDDQARVTGQSHGDEDALALPPGELVRIAKQ